MLLLGFFLVPGVALAADGASLSTLLAGIGFGWLVSAAGLAKNPRLGVLLAGLMGLGISLYLGVEHAQTGDMACSVDATFDCGSVVRSKYSTLAGIPIAFLGSGFYAAASFVGLMALLKPGEYERGGRLLTWGGIISVVFSAYLAWASMQLGKWCLFCISMYGVNALLLVAGILWDRSTKLGESDRATGAMIGAGGLVFVLTMLFTGQAATAPPAVATGASGDALAAIFEAPAGKMTLDGTEPIYGNPSAPYTVVEFADFECPYCGKVAPELKKLVDGNPDIRLMFKHYPLSPLCNESVQRDMHPHACGAAHASECARHQERFWELSSLMFKNQSYLSPEDLKFLTQQVGMDAAAFETCMSDPMTETAVLSDISHATTLDLHGTPALFLLGVTGSDWVSITGSPEEIGVLVGAHREGREIPPTPPAGTHGH
ncbi:MAG: protein-disulfide isomerase/uncharacterized membrane protein [Myxococcota bacterium]|jgi:protein-disulfide isomerase/uncharacterized membrane protein